jgi:hypothetical protein
MDRKIVWTMMLAGAALLSACAGAERSPAAGGAESAGRRDQKTEVRHADLRDLMFLRPVDRGTAL